MLEPTFRSNSSRKKCIHFFRVDIPKQFGLFGSVSMDFFGPDTGNLARQFVHDFSNGQLHHPLPRSLVIYEGIEYWVDGIQNYQPSLTMMMGLDKKYSYPILHSRWDSIHIPFQLYLYYDVILPIRYRHSKTHRSVRIFAVWGMGLIIFLKHC